jgi:hypothetical protein
VRAVLPTIEPDGGDPFIDETGVLSSAEMTEVVHAAGKKEVACIASTALEP